MPPGLPAKPPPFYVECDRCDEIDGDVTRMNRVSVPIAGRVCGVDWCVHRIVAALNAGGVRTTASCCGHGTRHGFVGLADGRMLVVARDPGPDYPEARAKLTERESST